MEMHWFIYDNEWKTVDKAVFDKWEGTKGYGPDRIRMIMVDADGNETDMFALCHNSLCFAMNIHNRYIMPSV